MTPVAPDLFSIQGTENLGNKLVSWRKDWNQSNIAWKGEMAIPRGKPIYLGYVIQMHNTRASNEEKMTAGWAIYGEQLEPAIRRNIVNKLTPLDQVVGWEDNTYLLGKIPNLHSLIPYSLEARKPVFDCGSSDGLRGAHLKRAIDSEDHFKEIVAVLQDVATWP